MQEVMRFIQKSDTAEQSVKGYLCGEIHITYQDAQTGVCLNLLQ